MSTQVEQIAARVARLYTLPAVAMEVVQLTSDPNSDADALRKCLERDPALTGKVLRVVNSSLFGLTGQVDNLHQAVALLGTRPLELLVLGFSLPDELLADVRRDQLQWYWSTSLTRAVAARALSQSLWQESGDEAFLAALLQDVGLLALLQELDDAFVEFLARVVREDRDLATAEIEALGFDHRELTVAMLEHWKLPRSLIKPLTVSEFPLRLARMDSAEAETAKVLALADLVAQLVGQKRISVLPDLLEMGQLYRGLTKAKLYDLVGELQPQVEQLAEVMSLDLPPDANYCELLDDAHELMRKRVEASIKDDADVKTPDELCDDLLAESERLTEAMRLFLRRDSEAAASAYESISDSRDSILGARGRARQERTAAERLSVVASDDTHTRRAALTDRVIKMARGCRMRREEMSLLLIELDGFDHLADPLDDCNSHRLLHRFETTCEASVPGRAETERLSPACLAILLPDCERREAVTLANDVIDHWEQLADNDHPPTTLTCTTLSVAVATVTTILKNFSAVKLVEGAERCLGAARAAGGSAVKSIEVY